MDDSPRAIAERLTKYVDELLVARETRNALAVRGRTQMILRALEKLRGVHLKSALPDDLVSRIQKDKARAQVDLPGTSQDYQNVCWDCHAHGNQMIVDKRIDTVCQTCGWVQCPDCGACRDPKLGGCPDRVFRGSRRPKAISARYKAAAAEASWKHADVFPIIARIIESAQRELRRYVTAQDIATRLLLDNEARNLIELAREQQQGKQSVDWLASTWCRGSASASPSVNPNGLKHSSGKRSTACGRTSPRALPILRSVTTETSSAAKSEIRMRLVLCTALCLAPILLGAQEISAPSLRFETTPPGRHIVARLPAELAGKLPAGRLTQERGETVLTLSLLDDAQTPGPHMLGKYDRAGNELTFTPRFPLSAGATYRAILKTPGKTASLDYVVPKLAAKDPPRVVKIHPTADVLPANHLRFYIYFDRPMRGGKELFKHLAIVDHKGNEIEEPWLVDEIWDEANNCLILYIHPGRIKWGVELRELMGPVLHEKRSYALVVRGAWTDLEGNKLGKDVIKKFRTTAEDRLRIELGDWEVAAPRAGTLEPVELKLAKSIDYRSLHSGLTVTGANGQRLAGKVQVGPAEKNWRFTPAEPWHKGPHAIVVNPDLEDVAGNTPSRPFDMDLGATQPPAQKMHLAFQPR
jgi:hypothetical protein